MWLAASAAAAGAIDFSEADPFDLGWSLKRHWVLSAYEQQQAARIFAVRHLGYMAQAANGKLPVEAVKEVWALADGEDNNLLRASFPWLSDKQDPGRTVHTRAGAARKWKDVYGDPGDPATKRKIAATEAAMRQEIERRRKLTRR